MQCIKKIYRAPNKGRRGVRIIVYGLTTTGLALGATLAYANYDPGFKEDVNKYVPGFAALADFAADRWVDLVDFVNPKQNASVGLKTEKERVKMFESIKPKEDPVKKIEDEETAKQPKAQKTDSKADVKGLQKSPQTSEAVVNDSGSSGSSSEGDRISGKQSVETTSELEPETVSEPEAKEPETAPLSPDVQSVVVPPPPVDPLIETEGEERASSAVEGREQERAAEGSAAAGSPVETPAGEETAKEVKHDLGDIKILNQMGRCPTIYVSAAHLD